MGQFVVVESGGSGRRAGPPRPLTRNLQRLSRRQPGVHQRDHAGALAARRGDPLHRAGADVADGEDAGHRGREVGRRQAVDPALLGTSRPVSTKPRSSRATLGRQPVAVGLGAEQQEEPARLARSASPVVARRGRRATRGGPSPPPSTTSVQVRTEMRGLNSISLMRYCDMVSARSARRTMIVTDRANRARWTRPGRRSCRRRRRRRRGPPSPGRRVIALP